MNAPTYYNLSSKVVGVGKAMVTSCLWLVWKSGRDISKFDITKMNELFSIKVSGFGQA